MVWFLRDVFQTCGCKRYYGLLEQACSHIVDHLVSAKADDYLLSMIKYVIEKSEIRDREAFYNWVHTHLSPPLEAKTMTLAEQLRRARYAARYATRHATRKIGR